MSMSFRCQVSVLVFNGLNVPNLWNAPLNLVPQLSTAYTWALVSRRLLVMLMGTHGGTEPQCYQFHMCFSYYVVWKCLQWKKPHVRHILGVALTALARRRWGVRSDPAPVICLFLSKSNTSELLVWTVWTRQHGLHTHPHRHRHTHKHTRANTTLSYKCKWFLIGDSLQQLVPCWIQFQVGKIPRFGKLCRKRGFYNLFFIASFASFVLETDLYFKFPQFPS